MKKYILYFALLSLFYTPALKAEINLSGIKDKETIEIIKKAPSPDEQNPYINAIMLLLDEKCTIKNADTAIRKRHVIIKVLKEAGKEAGTVTITFNEYLEKLKINLARTIQSDGKIQNVSQDAIKDESSFTELPIYSDIKVRKITFPNVQVGSIIEYDIEVMENTKTMPGFSYLFTLPVNWTFSLVRFSAEVPKDMPVKFKAEKFINNEPVVTPSGNYDQYTWQMEHTYVKGGDEPAASNYMKIGPYVIFSTIEDWQKINEWGIKLMKDQCSPDKAIEEKAAELLKGQMENKRDIIKPIFNYVSQQIRYVAIELGLSAFKPYSAAEVFKNSYGDCKGKSALLIAMLESIGIEAYPVLLMTANAGFIVKDVPGIYFNHMIVAVPDGEGYIFLDPTADMLSFDSVPYFNQGCNALVLIKGKGAEDGFVYIPIDSPENNKITSNIKVNLNRDLSADLEESVIWTGQLDWQNRILAKYTPPEQYKRAFEESGRLFFAGFKLKELMQSNYNELETPFNITMTYAINNYSRKSGNLLLFNVSAPTTDVFLSSLVTKVPREAPLFLGFPLVGESRAVIKIPEGYKIKALPKI